MRAVPRVSVQQLLGLYKGHIAGEGEGFAKQKGEVNVTAAP